MNQRLQGKVALITGASAGIGQACARALGAEGAHLVLTARRGERLDALRKELERGGGQRVVSVLGDAREERTAAETVRAATDAFGKVDILVNNTGVGNYKNLVDTSADDYDEMMDTNVRSTFLFTRHVVPVMVAKKQGTILMISSMAGIYGFAGEAVYCATKFAQVGFAQALDKELRPHGIKVGLICPGGVKTEFALGKGRRLGHARERGRGGGGAARLHAVAPVAHHRNPDAHDGRGADLSPVAEPRAARR